MPAPRSFLLQTHLAPSSLCPLLGSESRKPTEEAPRNVSVQTQPHSSGVFPGDLGAGRGAGGATEIIKPVAGEWGLETCCLPLPIAPGRTAYGTHPSASPKPTARWQGGTKNQAARGPLRQAWGSCRQTRRGTRARQCPQAAGEASGTWHHRPFPPPPPPPPRSVQGKQASICGLTQAPASTRSSCPPGPLCCLQRAGDMSAQLSPPRPRGGGVGPGTWQGAKGQLKTTREKPPQTAANPRDANNKAHLCLTPHCAFPPTQPEMGWGAGPGQALAQPHTHPQPPL